MARRTRTDYRCDTCSEFSYKYSDVTDPKVYAERLSREKRNPLECRDCGGIIHKIYPVLGPTRLGDIQKCRKYYKLVYKDKADIPTTAHLAFGAEIHEMLKEFYTKNFQSEDSFVNSWYFRWGRAKRGENERLGEIYVPDCKARPYVLGWYTRLGADILRNFYKRHVNKRIQLEERRKNKIEEIEQERRKLLIAEHRRGRWKLTTNERNEILEESDIFPKAERDFMIEWKGHYLRGRIDVSDMTDDGLIIGDFKTDKVLRNQRTDFQLAEKPHQFTTYHVAAEDIFGENPYRSYMYHLRSGNIIPIHIVNKHIENLDEDLTEAENFIKDGDFRPNVGYQCRFCSAHQICLDESIGDLPPTGEWDEEEAERHWGTDFDIL